MSQQEKKEFMSSREYIKSTRNIATPKDNFIMLQRFFFFFLYVARHHQVFIYFF
jgi:hypothetical protein